MKQTEAITQKQRNNNPKLKETQNNTPRHIRNYRIDKLQINQMSRNKKTYKRLKIHQANKQGKTAKKQKADKRNIHTQQNKQSKKPAGQNTVNEWNRLTESKTRIKQQRM